MATWGELSTCWSMDDVAKAHAIIDMKATIAEAQHEAMQAKMKAK